MKREECLYIVQQMITDGIITQDDAVKYFPELAESEDERKLKELLFHFKQWDVIEEYEEDIKQWIQDLIEKKKSVEENKGNYGGISLNELCDDEKVRKELLSLFKENRDGISHICNKPACERYIAYLEKRRGQKPAWSKKDEETLKWLCRIIHSQRVLKVITLKEESELGGWMDKWLNHNPQQNWKPTKKQIIALRWVLNHIPYDSHKEEISGLLEQLKKL